MTQSNILELARQGDAKAIASLMNGQLQPKQINAKVSAKNGCVQVLLEAAEVPDRDFLVAWVVKTIVDLGSESIERVKIFGRQTGCQEPAWSQELEIAGQKSPVVEEKATSISSLNSETKPKLRAMQEEAKNGDLEALIWLLNIPLKKKGIAAAAIRQGDRLQVMLEATQIPDSKTAIQVMRRELKNLNVPWIESVTVYGQKTGEDFPAWEQEFELWAEARQQEIEKIANEKAGKLIENILKTIYFIIIAIYSLYFIWVVPWFLSVGFYSARYHSSQYYTTTGSILTSLVNFVILSLLALLPAIFAKQKGRRFWLWYYYGFLVWIFAIIHVFIIQPKS
ncbi:MAG: hypothetical protein ACRC62_39645 [Microcoleus sp.]